MQLILLKVELFYRGFFFFFAKINMDLRLSEVELLDSLLRTFVGKLILSEIELFFRFLRILL